MNAGVTLPIPLRNLTYLTLALFSIPLIRCPWGIEIERWPKMS